MKKIKNKQIGLNILLIILALLIVVPFLLVVSISLSKESDIVEYGYSLFPKNATLEAYKYVFENPGAILNGYKVTAMFSVATMILGVLLMSMLAYPLSRKCMPGRRGVSFYVFFTTLFSGGLVPTYILITQYLHLGNTIWVYILPSLVGSFFVFTMRSFFQDIPEEIIESVLVDGGNEYTIYFKFVLPLSKPVLATVALLTFLGKWNDWNTALLYIDDENLMSLQYLLQRIMKNIELLQSMSLGSENIVSVKDIPSETVRMAMAVVVAGPALVIFPFFQKYFVRGLTVGSVKG